MFIPCFRCSDSFSRIAAYDLLVELSDGCVHNLTEVCKELIHMHHQANPDLANEWEVGIFIFLTCIPREMES